MTTKIRMLLIIIAMAALPLLACDDEIDKNNLTEPQYTDAAAAEAAEDFFNSQ